MKKGSLFSNREVRVRTLDSSLPMSSRECLREKFHRQSFVYFACFVVPPEKFLPPYPDVVVNGCDFF